jgi:endoglucanase
VSWSKVLKPYHTAVIDTIRKYDPDNLIVCGTPNWSQWVDSAALDPIKDANVAYTLHFYAGTHKQNLRERAKFALDHGVAIMITEYGTTDANGNGAVDEAETKRWWEFMDENDLSGCNWSVADKNESSAALKPSAAAEGGWKDDQISVSGLLVRSKHRVINP